MIRISVLLLAAALGCSQPVDAVQLGAPLPGRPETDQPRVQPAHFDDGVARLDLGHVRASAVLPDGRAVVVDEPGRLVLTDGVQRRVLLDAVVGVPAVLGDGKVLATRSEEPGQADLWIVEVDDAKARPWLTWPGAEGQPTVLPDGRVLFVADRGGVASLYVANLDGSGWRQLTNHHARPGALGDRFVPPPVRVLRQEGSRVIYDAGDATWFIDVDSGATGVLP
ncbi:MAG: hypothetical protein AB2A00_27900 [Myxococcota bacterium]